MAKKSIKNKEIDVNALLQQEQIINADLADELSDDMLQYSLEVIKDRALASVYDGLKPVQRRILWAGWVKHYLSNGQFVKCAKFTGDVMGDYH